MDSPLGEPTVPDTFTETYLDGEECQWIRGPLLGQGGFSKVYTLTSNAGEKVAGKVIAKTTLKTAIKRQRLRDEIRVHRSLEHEHVVRWISHFEVSDYYILVMEQCTNKTLAHLLKSRKRLSEPEAGYYLAQILDGVRYLHGRNIVHRDLKPGNLLLTDTLSVKIGDFGLAKQLTYKEEMLFLTVGTPNYVAPEILTPGEVGYSFPVDIWSMGCLLYKLLTGKCPFETSSVETTYSRIRDGIFYFPDRVKMSDNAKDLIHHMLTKDPTQRITLEEIAQHAFFDGTPTELSILVMEPKFANEKKD